MNINPFCLRCYTLLQWRDWGWNYMGGLWIADQAIKGFMRAHFILKYLCHTTIKCRNTYSTYCICNYLLSTVLLFIRIQPCSCGTVPCWLNNKSSYWFFSFAFLLQTLFFISLQSTPGIIWGFGDMVSHPAGGCPAWNRLWPQMETPGQQQCYCTPWYSNETWLV